MKTILFIIALPFIYAIIAFLLNLLMLLSMKGESNLARSLAIFQFFLAFVTPDIFWTNIWLHFKGKIKKIVDDFVSAVLWFLE